MTRRGRRRELWPFVHVRKKWRFWPGLIMLASVGALLVFAHGSALALFIYTLFSLRIIQSQG